MGYEPDKTKTHFHYAIEFARKVEECQDSGTVRCHDREICDGLVAFFRERAFSVRVDRISRTILFDHEDPGNAGNEDDDEGGEE